MTQLALDAYGHPIPAVTLGNAQSLTLTSSASTSSTALASTTSLVWVWADVDVWLDQGATPVASSSRVKWPAYTPLALRVRPGDLIAARAVSASSGTLNLFEGL